MIPDRKWSCLIVLRLDCVTQESVEANSKHSIDGPQFHLSDGANDGTQSVLGYRTFNARE